MGEGETFDDDLLSLRYCRVYEIRHLSTGAFRKRSIEELGLHFIDRSPADEVHQRIDLLHAPYLALFKRCRSGCA